MKPTDPKKPEKKYSWTYSGGKIACCTSETSSCTVSKLWEVDELTAFHDARLQKATSEINAILDELRERNGDAHRDLSFVQIGDRHFLAWTDTGVVGPHDDRETVRKALRLRTD